MRGISFFVVFLVLSASLLCTTEAARSRTSNQNSFRRAANGIYQTLSSVFGEDNIRGLYKVSMETFSVKITARSGFGLRTLTTKALVCCENGEQETSALGPGQQFHGCHFEKLAIILCFIHLSKVSGEVALS